MQNIQLIGREKEVETLRELLDSYESEMVSVIGRQGLGKRHLVESVYAERIVFKITGLQNVTERKQLNQFFKVLNAKIPTPTYLEKRKTWFTAFHLLSLYLGDSQTGPKRVIFFDEIAWLGKESADFIMGFGYFWNSWAINNNFVVVISASAGSWLREKILHNTGGLYHRVTKRIFLYPFSLPETEAYFQKCNLDFNRHQIVELYLAMGGIPRYLQEINNAESVAQNIKRICFEPHGLLYNEFEKIYPASFTFPENHIQVVRVLAAKSSGMSQDEIIENLNLPNSDQLTKILKELIESDFVTDYYPFDSQQSEKIYRLTDEYSLFYIKFIENMKNEGKGVWQNFEQTPNYRIWSGYAFESICLKHIKHYSQTKKQVFFTFMSTYGVVKNENWGMIDKELTLDDLF